MIVMKSSGPPRQALTGSIEVVDGDTIRQAGRTIRLVGFDTPERGDNAKCASERALAERAKARLRQLIANGPTKLQLVPCACPAGTEGTPRCNFGRPCGMLYVNDREVGAVLINEGLAHPFTCGATSCPPRQAWC
jgi:endonuclease YncB( thermonuclease family)